LIYLTLHPEELCAAKRLEGSLTAIAAAVQKSLQVEEGTRRDTRQASFDTAGCAGLLRMKAHIFQLHI
jgi:hypothetical protein